MSSLDSLTLTLPIYLFPLKFSMLHRNVFSQFFFSICYVITLVARTVHNGHCTWCLLVYPTLTFPIYLSQPPQTNGHYWIFPTISQFLNKHQCLCFPSFLSLIGKNFHFLEMIFNWCVCEITKYTA